MSNIHIYEPLPVEKRLHSLKCLDCKKKSYFVSFYYEWYGASATCLRCGRNYQDREWMSLPFYRYARKDSIENAKKHYRSTKISTIKAGIK